jgi:hypothetical protein
MEHNAGIPEDRYSGEYLHITSAEGEVGIGACPICEDGNGLGAYAPRNSRPQQATKNGLRQTDVDRFVRLRGK